MAARRAEGAGQGAGQGAGRVALLWLTTDLRLHDHPALLAALRWAGPTGALLCLWVSDEAHEGRDPFGAARRGAHRERFELECALRLAEAVEGLGGALLLERGDPAARVAAWAAALREARGGGGEGAARVAVFAHHAYAHDEVARAARAGDALRALHVPFTRVWGETLYDEGHLPFPLERLPRVFTDFRRAVEAAAPPPRPLPAPARLPPPPDLRAPPLAPLHDAALAQTAALRARHAALCALPRDPRARLWFEGGEGAALARVARYFWGTDRLATYKETRNGLLDPDDSSRLSPWLAAGALSARGVWWESLRYEEERVRNESTYWLRFELLWREHFRWVARRWGGKLFTRGGLRAPAPAPAAAPATAPFALTPAARAALGRWRRGETGDALVDACMRELSATGWMSNRGRQNAASLLVHDLGVDWRAGAGVFEELLVDYDPASNWGGWAYIAGVGTDPRPFRRFNTARQAEEYDPSGAYRRWWG